MEYQSGIGVLVVVLTAIFVKAVTALGGTVRQRESLWPGLAPVGDGSTERAKAYITIYQPDKPNGTAVIICPGGGYRTLMTKGDGRDIARWFNRNGIIGIVLEYRLPGGKPYRPLLDAQRAIRAIRSRSKELGCRPDRIGVIGFSAGGHLASAAATHFDTGDLEADDPIEKMSCRPDFSILIYPVITLGKATHPGSYKNLLGDNPSQALIDLFSTEKQVTKSTPPCFLAHAKDDKVVLSENSKLFYDALVKSGVSTKYLELERGDHGLNGHKGPMWERWQAHSIVWMQGLK